MISFTIPGKPQPWRRARTNGKTFFKDARTKANQNAWARAAKAAGVQPTTAPIAVTIVARFGIAKAATKPQRAAMLAGQLRPTGRPDADNIVKNLDALNGVAFADDAQVVSLTVSKVYADEPGVDVTITEIAA
jgi:Holliday junction resolvase RusA-like endonuclease